MKTITIISTIALSSYLLFSCEKEKVFYEDSPVINASFPYHNQEILDSDSVLIRAKIMPTISPVISYHVSVVNNDKKTIYDHRSSCDCKENGPIEIKESFKYNIRKTANLILHIQAELKDGDHIREEIPFKLIDKD